MKKLYTLFTLVCLFYSADAQISKGKNFWFGLMANYTPVVAPVVAAYITTDVATTGVISIPDMGWSQAFTVTPGVSTKILLPLASAIDVTSDAVTGQGIHVVSQECVSVFSYNGDDATADASIVYPINSIGKDYIANTYQETSGGYDGPTEIIVIGNYPGTTVSITPSVAAGARPAGVPFNITLDSGQTYMLQATGDLTGTRVSGVNGLDFSLCAGAVCITVNNACCCDHIYEQMAPIPNLGTEYVTVPYGVPQPDKFRVVAVQNGTNVTKNGAALTTLNAGQYYDYNSTTVDYITSNLPVSIVQLMGSSQSGGGANDLGDPFMIALNPTAQRINVITFPTIAFIGTGNYYWYVNVVAKTSDVSTITLDGASLPVGTFTPAPGNNAFSTAHISIAFGDHHIASNQGVIGYVYGYSDAYESFGYQAGVLINIPHLSIYDSSKAYCPFDTVNIALNSPDSAKIISDEWILGDGSPHLFDTLRFWHVYNNYGSYPVTLIYLLQGACEPDTVTIDTIKILGPQPDLGGPYEFCSPQSITINATARVTPDTLFWRIGNNSYFTLPPNTSITLTATQDTVIYLKITSNICPGYDTAYVYVGHDLAAFTFSNACDNSPVVFTNTSQYVAGLTYQWMWDFGDGSTSGGFSPTHTYASGGTYTVKLKLISPAGCMDSVTQSVTIYAKPTGGIVVNPVCNDSVFTPIDNMTISGGTITYDWNFGDGSAHVNSANPSHIYSQSGAYNVTLIASGGPGCADTISLPLNMILGADINFSGVSTCLGSPTVFTDLTVNNSGSAVLGYNWTFGDGNSSTIQNPTNIYANAGNYNVTLTLNYGSGCFDSLTLPISINSLASASFTVSDLCNTGTAAPVNTTTPITGTMTFQWLFGDGTAPVAGLNPSHTYAMSGNYNIQLVASDSSCRDTVANPINVIRGTIPNFSTSPVCIGAVSTFTDQTANPYNTTIIGYNWTFGDGNSSTLQNPTNTYASTGTFTVQLELDYGSNCADSISQQVTVDAAPVASFTISDVCNDSIVTPVNNTTGASTYTWNFGDGSAPVPGLNPSHTYQQSNTYNVQLIAFSASGCADTVSNSVTDVIGTHIDFTVPPVCDGNASTFTDQTTNPYATTITGYAWSFGDGNFAAQQNTTHTYSAPGNYTVQLVLTYNNNCADSLTKQITVNPNPVAAFSSTTPCVGALMQFTDLSTPAGQLTTWAWSFGDGNSGAVQNPTHNYTASGNYNVQLIAGTANGCTNTVTQQVTVLGKGTAAFTAPDVCLMNSTPFTNTTNTVTYPVSSYAWTFGDAIGTSAQTNPTYLYANPGTYNVTLIANFANGCDDTTAHTVNVFMLPTVSEASTNVSCAGGTDGSMSLTPLIGTQPFTYIWSNGGTAETDAPVAMGTYTVTFTDAHTCTATATYTVTQPTAIVVDTVVTPILCATYTDGVISIQATGGSPSYNFNWSNGNSGSTLSNLAAGTYSVTVTDAKGCSVTISVILNDPPVYTIILDSVATIDLGKSVELSPVTVGGNPATWLWTPIDFLNCATCQNPIASPVNDYSYTVQTVSDNGCIATSTIRITVIPKYDVFIPDAFTPNGDGNNDYFQVFGNKDIWKQFEVTIFDRIGEKVYESSDMNFKWDGTYKGQLLNSAVFVYMVKVVYLDNHADKIYKGSVTLIR